ncbi:MAG TPA: hypothetical protein VFG42_24545 [Baekduia sp.]|uniref:hypothetical protein n=1 Tax=Baekduia sp. TaxID=2600305 RepID=UPI002D795A0A|nr:hypothetical protein [Baekduia sp.]HET6509986.1 hypothetical protein [Baekduia sp.]
MPDRDQTTLVDLQLAAAGLDPGPVERAALHAMHAAFAPGIDALYALPAARYEVPALVFDPRTPAPEW